ncbi:formylglycine-generating enzyme family protein [Isoptericola aurantiacus]|uniref:formylglycine-generating enzyme family protein n=1 Tax=Isoptericola aurantiacus TaxID=3377839 RepID=UPI00383BB62F
MAVTEHVNVPGGRYRLGDHFDEGYPADGESPTFEVAVEGFDIDATPVTNAQFGAFVEATGHQTDAERYGDSAVFHLAVAARPEDVVGRSGAAPWWLRVRGADWRHPYGPTSGIDDLAEHPVVHVSWADARAYAGWAGCSLPTEAQWEVAARGGLVGARFAWGDELTPGGRWMCNIWQGRFPTRNTAEDGWLATSPVATYPPNGYGLYDVAGNVWEWCEDVFRAARPDQGARVDDGGRRHLGLADDGVTAAPLRRVTRGGSYLCHDSYCHRYRVAARTGNTPDSTAGNCGFRTVGR